MGDLQTDQGESLELFFVPAGEFRRVIDATAGAVQKAEMFAALARINGLPFDVIDETSIVQVFSDRLRESSRLNHEDTKEG